MYYKSLLLPDVRQMIQEQDREGLSQFCEVFHPANAAEVLQNLSTDDFWFVMSCAETESRVEIFSFLDLPDQVEFMESIPADQTVPISVLEEMAPDDRVDLLSKLEDDYADKLVSKLSQSEQNTVHELLSYEDESEESAGAIMTTEFAWLPEELTVQEAIEKLRAQAQDRETIYYVYILEESKRLLGLVSFRQLILADPASRLREIMQRDLITVRVDDDREKVAQELAKYDLIAIPVVDNQHHLVGIITHDDVLDVMQIEATEDAHRQAAVEPLEESYLSTPILTLVHKRGVWLILLLVAAAATVSVLQKFEGDLMAVHGWLMWFLPLVIASGGNAGSQSATLVIRMLTLEQTSREESVRLALREFLLAICLGSVMSLMTFFLAWFFWIEEEPVLLNSAIVGVTVFLVVLLGTVTGAMLPLGFKKLGMDPALMSNPLISALVDFFGLLVYYIVAVSMLQMA